jgi:hypothetical protein
LKRSQGYRVITEQVFKEDEEIMEGSKKKIIKKDDYFKLKLIY